MQEMRLSFLIKHKTYTYKVIRIRWITTNMSIKRYINIWYYSDGDVSVAWCNALLLYFPWILTSALKVNNSLTTSIHPRRDACMSAVSLISCTLFFIKCCIQKKNRFKSVHMFSYIVIRITNNTYCNPLN